MWKILLIGFSKSRCLLETYLFTAIRLSKIRLIPAIARRKRTKPLREHVMRWARIVSPLKAIPLASINGKSFFLDAYPSPNSKAYFVLDELAKKNVFRENIYTTPRKSNVLISGLGIIYYCFALLPLLVRLLKRRKTNLDILDKSILVGYSAYKHFLNRDKSVIPIIISDITPQSHMLWAAAISLNREVMWWQDDYHHYKGISKENYLPYPCTHAAVLNQKGLETVLGKSPNAKIFHREQTNVKPIRSIPAKPRVGLATNAFFEATGQQIDLLKQIKEILTIDVLKVRLHPNSTLNAASFPEGLVEISPKDENVGDFASGIDLAIVGNSAVQLKLLCEGVPVVHVAGLDEHRFDTYRYCQLGFCFGRATMDGVYLEGVRKFYANACMREKLSAYVNVTNLESVMPLSELRSDKK